GSGSGSDASAGWTQIEFSDGTILKLEPGTELEMTSMQDGKRLGLTRGRMSAVVAPQPAGQPMQVTTPQSLVTVVGTHFSLAVTGAATRLQVDEGHVRLMRTADLASVEVLRGQFVVAEAGMDLAVKPVEAGPVEVAAAPQQPEQRELPHDGAREEPRRPDDAEPARQPPHEPLAQEPAQEKPREGQPQEQWAGREPPPENPSLKDREHPPAPAPAPHEEVLGDHEAIGRVTEIASNHSSFQVQVQRAGNKEFVGRTVTFLANWVREGERTGPKEADVKLIHGLNVGDEVRVRWHIEEHFRIDAVTVLEHARTKPAGAHEEEHPAPHEAAPRHD
ncbi:MAG: FecR domain-containing protein, partial [Planctomycetota bacterium]